MHGQPSTFSSAFRRAHSRVHEKRDDRLRLAGLVRANEDRYREGRGVQSTCPVSDQPDVSSATGDLPPVLNLASLIPLNGAAIASVCCAADVFPKCRCIYPALIPHFQDRSGRRVLLPVVQ